MSSNDSSDRMGSRRDQRSSPSDRPQRSSTGRQPETPGDSGTSGSESSTRRVRTSGTDFGSFVSSTARSSADRFKTAQGRGGTTRSVPPASQGSAAPGGESTSERPAPRSERSRRYWRDAAPPPGDVEERPAAPVRQEPARTTATSSRSIRLAGREQGSNDRPLGGLLSGVNLPSRTLLGIIGGVVVLLLLLVFALSQLGGDGNGDYPGPTATVQSVFDRVNGLGGTPGGEGAEDPANTTGAPNDAATEPAPGETPESTEDAGPRRGGDNQLEPPDGGTETPAASVVHRHAGMPQADGF